MLNRVSTITMESNLSIVIFLGKFFAGGISRCLPPELEPRIVSSWSGDAVIIKILQILIFLILTSSWDRTHDLFFPEYIQNSLHFVRLTTGFPHSNTIGFLLIYNHFNGKVDSLTKTEIINEHFTNP